MKSETGAGADTAAPLCPVHAGETIPAPADRRRCTALTEKGVRCKGWARRSPPEGHGPPLCNTHAGRTTPAPGDDNRCRALTRRGRRCRMWATRASRRAGRPRCNMHDGQARRPDEEARCTALTRSGERCIRWRMVGQAEGLCAVHAQAPGAHRPAPADEAAGRRCTAQTLAGARCAKWSLRDTTPPLCASHAYPDAHAQLRHGYYRTRWTPAERAAVASLGVAAHTPAAELVVLRLRLRALFAYLSRPDLTTRERASAARALLAGSRRVARLIEAGPAASLEVDHDR